MTRVLVLGATGMLGAMVLDVLLRSRSLDVSGTVRDVDTARAMGCRATSLLPMDAERGDTPPLDGFEWVVNCVGIIKPYIHDDHRDEVRRAIEVNAIFPMRLAEAAERVGARVLQIATDCVYSGRDGQYDESAPHDAIDVYGKSKSLGEVASRAMTHLRCSIIGPQLRGKASLLAWFMQQERGARLSGFRNHLWNGVTTLHYAKLCAAIITKDLELPSLLHVVPGNDTTKADLLRCFATEYGRADVVISDVDADPPIDRRVRTRNVGANGALWKAAGYETPPRIEEMVHEMATF